MDYSHWDLVQDFFLQHVVYLWFEGRLDETTAHPALDLTARLIEAIRAGELHCADAVFVEPGSLADLALGDRLDKNAYRYWRVRRDDLRAWCERNGFQPAFLFPEVRQPTPTPQPDSGPVDTVTNSIALSDAPSGQHYPEQPSQAPKAEPNLRRPSKIDDWFLAIQDTVNEFVAKHEGFPNETEVWARLRTHPPVNYSITAGKDNGEDAVFMGGKPLTRSAFKKRWGRYTPKTITPITDNNADNGQ